MSIYDKILGDIKREPAAWLVTGAAGFIGSHLAEHLLRVNQHVTGIDDLSACGSKNLDYLKESLPPEIWNNFTFIKGDIRDPETCLRACKGADFVLHHAAIGSVPRSLENPSYVDSVNVGGFLTILESAAQSKVKRFVYASSSAVYGDHTEQPNKEDQPIKPLSPYAVSKYSNELYAAALSDHYGLETVGLRYFNIYGPRQDPDGPYAAVIPKWISTLQAGRPVEIYGDGKTIRDFCHVDDVVQANILAATANNEKSVNTVYNIAAGQKTSLNDLFSLLQRLIAPDASPTYKPPRPGDIRISQAAIEKAKNNLGFRPSVSLEKGLENQIFTAHLPKSNPLRQATD